MSTEYYPVKPIIFEDLKKAYKGFRVDETAEATSNSICLTDGKSFLWAHNLPEGTRFTEHGVNDASNLLKAISKAFKTKIISEWEK